jgi:hypothetical protein
MPRAPFLVGELNRSLSSTSGLSEPFRISPYKLPVANMRLLHGKENAQPVDWFPNHDQTAPPTVFRDGSSPRGARFAGRDSSNQTMRIKCDAREANASCAPHSAGAAVYPDLVESF